MRTHAGDNLLAGGGGAMRSHQQARSAFALGSLEGLWPTDQSERERSVSDASVGTRATYCEIRSQTERGGVSSEETRSV